MIFQLRKMVTAGIYKRTIIDTNYACQQHQGQKLMWW